MTAVPGPDEPTERWSVYVLISATGKRTYVGITTDTGRRLEQHNGDRRGGAKATRSGRPWRIGAIHGPFESRGAALRVERSIKKLRGLRRLQWRVTLA